jgi:non-heme chloroperoxidase
MHREDDQIVAVKDSARKSAKLLGRKGNLLSRRRRKATAPHQDQVNSDLLAFPGE